MIDNKSHSNINNNNNSNNNNNNNTFLLHAGQEKEKSPTLKDVMVFLTGCDSTPPLGFGDVTPTVGFTDDNVLPRVSTCALTLTLPRNFPTNFDKFKEKMNFSILGSQGFFGAI